MRAHGWLFALAMASGGWVCSADPNAQCPPDPGRTILCTDGVQIENTWCPQGTVAACAGVCYMQPIQGCSQKYTCAEGPCNPHNGGTVKWTMSMGADQGSLGAPLAAGDPAETVDITIDIGTAVTSSCFDVVGGQWYVIDRGGNVVPFDLSCTIVSNNWEFSGTAGPGPAPDGLTATLSAFGASNGTFPTLTSAGGSGSWTISLNGAGSVTQNWVWGAKPQ